MNKDLKQGSGVKSEISPADGKPKLGDAAIVIKEIDDAINYYEHAMSEYIKAFNQTNNKHFIKLRREQIKATDIAIEVLKSLRDKVNSRFA